MAPRPAQLTEDLLRLIYTSEVDGAPVLGLRDRAAAGLPLRQLVLAPNQQGSGVPKELWVEVINAQPAVQELVVSSSSLSLLPALLHSLDRQALRVLKVNYRPWSTGAPCLDLDAFPCPAMFFNLRELWVAVEAGRGLAAWLGQISRLRCLEMLHLHILNGGGAGEGVQLPGMASLQRLFVNSSAPLAVDLGRMPQLLDLSLAAPEVMGTSTAADATQLTRLALGYFEHEALDQPWVADLLRSLPPSVRWLQLAGCFQSPVTEALGSRSQLRVLVVAMDMDGPCKLPPVTAPLWAGLCALYWLVPSYPLPQELRGAARLERLAQDLCNDPARLQDLELLCHLPALRHVVLEDIREDEADAARSLLRRAVPALASVQSKRPVRMGDMDTPWVEGGSVSDWLAEALA